MERSDSITNLATALALAQAEIEGASKDRENPHFRSRYADLASCWEACRKPLSKYGLSVVQLPKAEGATVSVTTLLLHKSGEFIGETFCVTAQDGKPQSVGSALTYARRYGLSAVVGIAPEDDDAEAAQGRVEMAPVNMKARQYVTTPAQVKDAVATGYQRGKAPARPEPEPPPLTDKDIPF